MKRSASSLKGFTLVEIMIVVGSSLLLAAIAVPGFLRARKRSQASRILNDLRMIDSACDQYAIETNRKTGDAVAVADWTNYLKKGSLLYNTGNSLCLAPLTVLRPWTRSRRCPRPTWRLCSMSPAPVSGRVSVPDVSDR
jgi:type II secretory pathway pseudopilin PulG